MRNQTDRELYERERELRREREVAHSNTAAVNGLLIGIMIIAVAGAIALFYAISQSTRAPEVPETQIIEPPDVDVQPPDVNVAPPTTVQPPDVNITVPPVTTPELPEATTPEQPDVTQPPAQPVPTVSPAQ